MTLEMFMDTPVNDAATRMKICTKCNTPKPATPEYFTREKRNRNGLRAECKECRAKSDLIRYHGDGGREKYYKTRHEKSPHRTALNNLRNRDREGKRKFLLGEARTPEAEAYIKYLQTITHCPDCAKELVWYSEGGKKNDSASFDRIDSNGDYTKENVRIVCFHCNSQKGDLLVDEWVAVLKLRIEKGILEEVDPRLLEFLSETPLYCVKG
jgi:Zn finger protein HypA/HybF involved in hydrogenase expression